MIGHDARTQSCLRHERPSFRAVVVIALHADVHAQAGT